MLKVITATAIMSLSLIGCATSSGVLSMADGLNTISVQAATASEAKQKAIEQAKDFCGKTKKEPEIANEKSSDDALGWHVYEANFHCK